MSKISAKTFLFPMRWHISGPGEENELHNSINCPLNQLIRHMLELLYSLTSDQYDLMQFTTDIIGSCSIIMKASNEI